MHAVVSSAHHALTMIITDRSRPAAAYCDVSISRRQIFVPVQVLNFTVNPPQWRIPFLSCAGFVYVMWLSFAHGNFESVEDREGET
eukprot:COSAG01_NODE_5166_length_4439_cov_1.964747_2_plen_86_part_00